MKGLQELEMMIDNREKNLYRNKKVPRAPLPYDTILESAIKRTQSKRDHFEEDIIKPILEGEEKEGEEKPMTILSESLKGYVKDIKYMQENKLASLEYKKKGEKGKHTERVKVDKSEKEQKKKEEDKPKEEKKEAAAKQ